MPRKYTLCLTHRCNLRCSYCYIDKRAGRMSIEVADRIVESIFGSPPPGDDDGVDIGFFGGEPLLEFDLLKEIVGRIERHPNFDRKTVTLSVVSNGTLLSEAMADYLAEHGVVLCLSCDGPPHVQDRFRKQRNGRASSARVVRAIEIARRRLPLFMVNAVYRPETLDELPATVDFLSGLGARQIYLNPDAGAPWRREDAAKLAGLYAGIGDWYVRAYLRNDLHFVSLIDSKIAVILRGGYGASERCQMGSREIAFTAEGRVYPCERLIGDGKGGRHCLGSIQDGRLPRAAVSFCTDAAARAESPCAACGIREYCMNWCGCSNYLATGSYDRVSPFLCASERAAVAAAARVYERLDAACPGVFSDHLAGKPSAMSRMNGRDAASGDRTSSPNACGGGQSAATAGFFREP
ncbi:MAG: radical SAM protein [Candidatus Nitricoxidivorans perseverans]|uniref:Radical SAM protein n=1 Tax=Candidatus Nitricoxidivorans perseverans TaxID=2975601 RepID=A0AA49FLV2_9PROT|nr:MAG: radical SAM protein [Candidatus Nitricoxidivorans perseverans]